MKDRGSWPLDPEMVEVVSRHYMCSPHVMHVVYHEDSPLVMWSAIVVNSIKKYPFLIEIMGNFG